MSEQYDKFYAALEKTLYLTPEDIDSNRAGQLSETQQARIQGQLRAASVGVGCISIFSLLPAIGIAILLPDWFIRAIILIGLVVWGFFFYRTYQKITNRNQEIASDLEVGQVDRLEGALGRVQTKERAGYYLSVNEQRFLVPRTLFDLAPEDEPVALYHLPKSKHFLALEFLDESSIDTN